MAGVHLSCYISPQISSGLAPGRCNVISVQYMLCKQYVKINNPFQMGIIFLAPPVDFTCAMPDNSTTVVPDKCECADHEFNRTVFAETIATEWNLVCDKEQFPNLSQTIFMLGILTGNCIFGSMADK